MALFCTGIIVGIVLGVILCALLDDDTTRGHPL